MSTSREWLITWKRVKTEHYTRPFFATSEDDAILQAEALDILRRKDWKCVLIRSEINMSAEEMLK